MNNPFKKGDRVRIRPGLKKQGAKSGTVHTSPRQPTLVSVVWDGTKSPSSYHTDLLVRAPGPEIRWRT